MTELFDPQDDDWEAENETNFDTSHRLYEERVLTQNPSTEYSLQYQYK